MGSIQRRRRARRRDTRQSLPPRKFRWFGGLGGNGCQRSGQPLQARANPHILQCYKQAAGICKPLTGGLDKRCAAKLSRPRGRSPESRPAIKLSGAPEIFCAPMSWKNRASRFLVGRAVVETSAGGLDFVVDTIVHSWYDAAANLNASSLTSFSQPESQIFAAHWPAQLGGRKRAFQPAQAPKQPESSGPLNSLIQKERRILCSILTRSTL